MDSGPTIVQERLRIHPADNADTLAARVLEIEHRIYPLALELVASGRVEMIDGECRGWTKGPTAN